MLNDTLKAISDPTRRKILKLLKDKPLSVKEILGNLDITGATLSHHLKILKQADLVSDVKQGNFIIYEINTSVMEEMLSWLNGFIQGGQDEK